MKKAILWILALGALCYWCSDDDDDNLENTQDVVTSKYDLDWIDGHYCGQSPYGTVWVHLKDGHYTIQVDNNSYHEETQEGRYTIGEFNGNPCLYMKEYGHSVETKFDLDVDNHRVSLGSGYWATKTSVIF